MVAGPSTSGARPYNREQHQTRPYPANPGPALLPPAKQNKNHDPAYNGADCLNARGFPSPPRRHNQLGSSAVNICSQSPQPRQQGDIRADTHRIKKLRNQNAHPVATLDQGS